MKVQNNLVEKQKKFCKILYVTEHFFNDFGWFI